MTGHDHLPRPDDEDVDPNADAVKQHRIRYNPSGRTDSAGTEATRIRYNPSRPSDDTT